MNENLKAYQLYYDTYMSQANSVGLSDSYIDKIQNGALDIETISDENIIKMINSYQDWYGKAKDVKEKIDETKKSIRELNISRLDNIKNDFNALSSLMEKITDYRDKLLTFNQSLGESIEESDYLDLIQDQNAIYDSLSQKYDKMKSELENLINAGDIEKFSDKWYEYSEELVDIKTQMGDCTEAVIKFKEEVVNLRFKELEDFKSEIDSVNEGLSTLSSLIGDDDLIKDGMVTDRGLAKLALYGKQLANAKQEAAEYASAIGALNEMYEQGDLTLEEYNSRLYEYQSAQNDATLAVKEATDAIIQMNVSAIEQQIDDMEKLIQSKKDALSAEKELADYQKDLANKQKNISNLQNKISALANSKSRSDQALKLQLEDELRKAQEELTETQYNHEIEMRQDALDKELEDYRDEKEKEISELKTNLDKQQAAVENYLNKVRDNHEIVYKTLTEYGNQYGLEMTGSLTSPWSSATSATTAFQNSVTDAVSKINYELSQIDTSGLSKLIELMNGYSSTTGNSTESYTDISKKGKWRTGKDGRDWFGEEYREDGDYYYASDGIYTINGKQYGFDSEGYMQTGWNDDYGEWRFFEPSNGQMVKSTWRQSDDGSWYYLKSDGTMARNASIEAKSGKGYYLVDEDGICLNNDSPVDDPDFTEYPKAYAAGTRNASKGLAHVNEEGYELLRTSNGDLIDLSGGEQIFDAERTKNLFALSSFPLDNLINTSLPAYVPVEKSDAGNLEINSPLFYVTGGLDSEMKDWVDSRIKEIPKIISTHRKIR